MLDRLLPRYDVREYHDTAVRASPEAALAAALEMPAAPDRVMAVLFTLRRIPHRGITLRGLFERMSLEATSGPRSYVGVLSPWRGIRIAFALWSTDDPAGARLATETRVRALSPSARIAFAAYWLVVGPFSALIRRRWLAAAKRRLPECWPGWNSGPRRRTA